MFEISLFGTTTVRSGDRTAGIEDLPGGKPRRILEIVALAHGAVVPKARIVELLWPRDRPAGAVATLDTYVAVIRRAVQPGVRGRDTLLRTVAGGYRLDPAARVDLDAFDTLVTAAERATPAASLPLWDQAVRMSGRDVLEHEPYVDWAAAARDRYRQAAVRAAVLAAHAAAAAARPEAAVQFATTAVRRDPLAEEGWQALIGAHGRAGRPAEVVRAFRACRHALLTELGAEPSGLTRRIVRTALGSPDGLASCVAAVGPDHAA